MLNELRIQLQHQLAQSLKQAFPEQSLPSVEIETPADKKHGEFSSNIALKSAKLFKKSPLDIAAEFQIIFQNVIGQADLKEKISKIEIKKPGFINFYLTHQAFYGVLEQVFEKRDDYGRIELKEKKKWQIEFVSANPTGPLSVAHARQAAVGDALANILNFIGYEVHKEYYINDGGNQIRILGESIRCRSRQILGENVPFLEDGYQGEYIKEMAQEFLNKENIQEVAQLPVVEDFMAYGRDTLLDVIKKELDDFGVHFDFWARESQIATPEKIEEALNFLKDKGYIEARDGAVWFLSTKFGDDKDRVVKKSDGAYTYLMPDIVYHKHKLDRGFDKLIDILGPDHHGYINRITAAVQALGWEKDALEVAIVQLATIYRNGTKVSMSTRGGQYVTLREVMDEVGVDVSRFFFLMRHMAAHLDFDLDLAKKESSENPVYYIQYAHARVHSMNTKAQEAGIKAKESNFGVLKESEEIALINKIGEFSSSLNKCHYELDPYSLVTYLQELAACFHKFYDVCRVVDADKDLSAERLGLVNAAKVVLANGLRLLGVSVPEKM